MSDSVGMRTVIVCLALVTGLAEDYMVREQALSLTGPVVPDVPEPAIRAFRAAEQLLSLLDSAEAEAAQELERVETRNSWIISISLASVFFAMFALFIHLTPKGL